MLGIVCSGETDFTVTNADTGEAALQVAHQLQPNLILLDVHLPDIDGRDLCHQVKTDSNRRTFLSS
jgi:CheY-like chemotaxis protein